MILDVRFLFCFGKYYSCVVFNCKFSAYTNKRWINTHSRKILIILFMPRILKFEIVSLAIIPNITFPWFERFHVSEDVPKRHASQGGQRELRTK